MERIELRYQSLMNALKSLEEVIEKLRHEKPSSDWILIGRDSMIQRFEFSVDTFWKFLKEYITIIQKVTLDSPTPRRTFQEAVTIKLITQGELKQLFEMVDARNLTSHTYNNELAERISTSIPQYLNLMNKILKRINK